jgi:hypothetical protein
MNTVTRFRSPSWARIRGDFRAERAARAARRDLERDLASYTSPAELTELDAILGRHDDDEVADIRRILNRRRRALAFNPAVR